MTRLAAFVAACARMVGMDGPGQSVSFSKLLVVALLLAVWHRNAITTGVVVALLAASFGRSSWLAYLRTTHYDTGTTDTPQPPPPDTPEGDV